RHSAGGGGHGVHTLPPPTSTPPASTQAASSRASDALLFVQSSATSQGTAASLLQTPVGVPSGVASLQVPRSYLQQRTFPSFPHVERAAQRASDRFSVSSRQSDFRSRFRNWTTHRTYWPWFLHGTTDRSGCTAPSHGHAAATAAGTSA